MEKEKIEKFEKNERNEKFEKIEKPEKKEKPTRAFGKVSCAVLNLRENPSLNAKVLGFLEHDDKVIILEDQKDWLKVSSQKGNGFVVAEFISDQYTV